MAVDQAEFKQQVVTVAADSQIPPQVSTRRVSHTQTANEMLVAHASGFEISKRYPAVVTIWRRKQRKKSECHSAMLANAPANANPIMAFVMRLLAPSAMTNDRIAKTISELLPLAHVWRYRSPSGPDRDQYLKEISPRI
jgi:hypothetical protein